MPTLNQKGFAHLLLLVILLIGVGVGVYLALNPTVFRPKASQSDLKINKVGTYFFYWYDGPNNPNPNVIPYVPYGLDKNDKTKYSYKSLNFWKNNIQDMEYAGINYIFPVSMGQAPEGATVTWQGDPFGYPSHIYQSDKIAIFGPQGLEKALDEMNSPMRVGYFQDDHGLIGEFQDWADNDKLDNSNYCPNADYFVSEEYQTIGSTKQYTKPCKMVVMKTSDPATMEQLFFIQYTNQIKYFFDNLERRWWATHNGKATDDGGKPMIIFYGTGFTKENSDVNILANHYKRMKEQFKQDFGVEPFFITAGGDYASSAEFEDINDAIVPWMAAIGGSHVKSKSTGYVTGAIGPGQNAELLDENWRKLNHLYPWSGASGNVYAYSPRNKPVCIDPIKADMIQYLKPSASLDLNNPEHRDRSCDDFPEGAIDTHLKDSFNLVTKHYGQGAPIDLLMVETWNELIEGTGIMRAKNWPRTDSPGNKNFNPAFNKSEDTVLMTSLRRLLGHPDVTPPTIFKDGESENKNKPTGYLDGADNSKCSVYGWTVDLDDQSQSLKVLAYKDGDDKSGQLVGEFMTDKVRGDINNVGKPGFDHTLTGINDGRDHQINLYAVDVNDPNTKVLLNGSPKTIKCTGPLKAQVENSKPVGYVDGVDNNRCSVYGWAVDVDEESKSIEIHVYKDGNAGSGGQWLTSFTTDRERHDINRVGKPGFDQVLPGLNDGKPHQLHFWALDSSGENNNAELSGSPKTITCSN